MKVLIVDDNVPVLRATSRLLVHRGHETKMCRDHSDALVAATWADVALVDVDMPERSGPELVRSFLRNLPVVFYTGNLEAVPDGMRCLAKPSTVDQIVEALEAAMAGGIG